MMSDQQELLERETMGIQSDAFDQAFKTKSLQAMKQRPQYTPKFDVKHLFMAIDPNGGG